MASRKILTLVITNTKNGDTYYFSSERYITLPSDSIPNQIFQPRISNDPTFDKQINLKIWGGDRATSTIGFFDLINEDGAYDFLYTSSVFGPTITAEISVLFDTQSYDARFVAATLLTVEKVEPIGEDYIRVTIRDTGKLMEKAVSSGVYPSSANNQSLRGTPRAVVIGSVNQQVPLKSNIPGNLLDVHDSRLVYWDGLSVYSRGVLATKNTDWRVSINNTCFGIEYLVSMTGGDPFTATWTGGALDISSTLVDGSNGGDFTTWAGTPNLPSGWTLVGTMVAGTREIVQNGNTCRFHVTATGTAVQLRKSTISIPTNSVIFFEFDITAAAVAGSLSIILTQFNGTTVIASKVVNVNATGHYADTIQVGANAASLFHLSCGTTNIDCSIDNFRLYVVTDTKSPVNAAKHLAVTRGGLTSSRFDSAAWAALDIPGYTDELGIYTKGDAMIADLLDFIATSYTAWWWFNRSGNLTVKQLYDPVVAAGPATTRLNKSQIVGGTDVIVEVDRAPGLSGTWLYDKNWTVLDDNDLAGSVTAANRGLYTAEFRTSGAATAPPSSFNEDSQGAPGIETCLMNMTVPQTEPTRVNAYYGSVRAFKTVKMAMDGTSYLSAELGDLASCDLARFGVSSNFHMVAGISGTYLSDIVTLKLWS